MDLLGCPGGGTQSRGALARSLTDKMSFLWRDLNLKNEQRTSDLEWKARVQERGLPIPGQMWEAAPPKVIRDRVAPGRQADRQF